MASAGTNGRPKSGPASRAVAVSRTVLTALLLVAGSFLVIRTHAYFSTGESRHRAETAALWFGALVVIACARDLGPSRLPAPDWSPPRAVVWGLVAIVVVLFWPALQVGLLSDDFVLLPTGRACWSQPWPFVRPLPLAIWAFVDAVLPRDVVPVALHALNLALHAANAALVLRLAAVLGLTRRAGAFSAVVFASFPASVEATVWAAGLQDVLLTTGALTFVLGVATRKGALTALGLAVALASKETAVVLPLLAAVMLFDRTRWRHLWKPLGLAALACIAFAGWRLFAAAEATGALRVAGRYGAKELLTRPFATLVLPWTTTELQGAPLAVALGVGTFVAALALVAVRGRAGVPSSGLIPRSAAWIVIAVLPVAGMFYVDQHLEGSRYLYLPLVGFAIGLGALGTALPPRVAGCLAVALVLVYANGVRNHIVPWRDAASARDATMNELRQRLAGTAGTVTVSEIPDSPGGAFVFRNGIREAVARELGCEAGRRLDVVD